jgi:hypothetical protein
MNTATASAKPWKPRFTTISQVGLAIICVGAVLAEYWLQPPPPTPEQIEVRKIRDAAEQAALVEQRRADKVKQVRRAAYCETAHTCKRYGKVRQECAVAGDFKNCVTVKMGDNMSYAEFATDCHDDGTVRWQLTNAPGAVECFYQRTYEDFLRWKEFFEGHPRH